MSIDPQHWRVGLIGYGEVGKILAEDLRKAGVKVSAYDNRGGFAPRATARDMRGYFRPRMNSRSWFAAP